MADPLKSGIKTNEGILTALTVFTSVVVNILVSLNVVEASEAKGLTEVIATGLTSAVSAVVAGVVLISYIRQRTQLKTEALKVQANKEPAQANG